MNFNTSDSDRASAPVFRFRPGRSIASLLVVSALSGFGFGPGAARAVEPPPVVEPEPALLLPLAEEDLVADEANREFSRYLWEEAQAFDPERDDPERLAAVSYGGPATMSAETTLRYNQVRQKSAHNSYERDEALLDQLTYHRIRSLELDIHNGKGGHSKAYQDWFVYHRDLVATSTTCNRLSDCLNELRAFHYANPYHEVVTVFLDLKDNFESGRNPADLDARLLAHIPSYAILKPSDLMAACTSAWSLQQAVQAPCGWPTLYSLRGKFIFVLTGGDTSSNGTPLNTYVGDGADALNRIGFVAPEISRFEQMSERSYVVFFNLEAGNMSLASLIRPYGFETRIYGLNSTTSFNNGRAWGGHHLGTDLVNYHADPGVTTHNGYGWPFQCMPEWGCPAIAENVRTLGMDINSDDIWGSKDNFQYLYEVNGSTANTTWRTMVSTPNSHVEPWAKGCLMARSSTASNSPYFAVCRPADENKLRIQWRSSTGGSTSSQEIDIMPGDTIDQESLSFLQLLVYSGGKCAAGYGSQDGYNFTLIGYKCFSVTLPRQGIATSAHGNHTLRLLYTNTTKNYAPYGVWTFPYNSSIGTVRGYWAFDGPFH